MAGPLRAGMRVHFMGIGGFGISAIARVMQQQGFDVSGCDVSESALIPPLRELGIPVEIGHDPAHLDLFEPQALVISSAIPEQDEELLAARAAGVPVYKRSDILGALMAGRTGIAVAGTHGKSTTSAMIAHVLAECGLDPTFIVGAVLTNYGTNARAGKGQAFVIEADEYDRMFMGLRPRVVVLTALEMDHPDMFADFEAMRALFEEFLALLPEDGLLIASQDNAEARAFAARRHAAGLPALTCGLGSITPGLTGWQASDIRPTPEGGMAFTAGRLTYQDAEEITVEAWAGALQQPGEHNVSNALAALAVAAHLGIEPRRALEALRTFTGIGRRFEVKGEAQGVVVIDDYAHHPTAIAVTLQAARDRYGSRPIWAVWQPHTYSRTRALLDEFAACFDEADHVIITDVFRSRDRETFGVGPKSVLERMAHPDARHIGPLDDVTCFLAEQVEPGDVVIVMSAGDATRISADLLKMLHGETRCADDLLIE